MMTTNTDRTGGRSAAARLPLRGLAAVAIFMLATQLGTSLAAGAQVQYLNISGTTFTQSANVDFARQVIGCVNQMPLNLQFDAAVNLPQGAVVKSITLYTFDTTANAASSIVQFLVSDNRGSYVEVISITASPT